MNIHPTWSYNSVIYEVNLRQYTPKGSIIAFSRSLPRLKDLGVDILWIMPICPIGEVERKGKLGSYYSIKNYTEVNPEFGTIDDFKRLVTRAHKLGMKVILDMVANHTAWDSKWISDGHIDWYEVDKRGNIVSPFDWTDTAKLNYNSTEMRAAMIDAMKFWIEECDIDGYREDMAGLVPIDFWIEAVAELKKLKKDIFMLGEVEAPEYHKDNTFDACYSWELHHFLERIATGEDTVDNLRNYLKWELENYPNEAFKMNFITNHDENSWHGSEFSRFGDATSLLRVFNYVYKGIPLIYSGEEAGSDKRIEFFDKDLIDWSRLEEFTPIYKELINLRHTVPALMSGERGGVPQFIDSSQPYNVLSFKRKVGDSIVIGIFNMTPHHIQPAFYDEDYCGIYNKLFHDKIEIHSGVYDPFAPWEFKVYYR